MQFSIDLVRLCQALNQQATDASNLVTSAENQVTLQANYTASILLFRLSSAIATAASSGLTQPSQPENPDE